MVTDQSLGTGQGFLSAIIPKKCSTKRCVCRKKRHCVILNSTTTLNAQINNKIIINSV